MKQIVIDAGPLIGLFYQKDTYHDICVKGFVELGARQTLTTVPLPIVFEVYKWLLTKTYSQAAQTALKAMEQNFYIPIADDALFKSIQKAVYELPEWTGSLEDATVALYASEYCCPIWTYNFRDFSIFQTLEFWNPEL